MPPLTILNPSSEQTLGPFRLALGHLREQVRNFVTHRYFETLVDLVILLNV